MQEPSAQTAWAQPPNEDFQKSVEALPVQQQV